MSESTQSPDFETKVFGTRHVISIVGGSEITVYDAPGLKAAIIETLSDAASTDIIVDLSGVTFFDSTACGALVEGQAAARDAEPPRHLSLFKPAEHLRKMINLIGLADVLPEIEELPRED